MKERPILFSGPMVRAVLDGTKTQTRRIVRPQPHWEPLWGTANGGNGAWLHEADPTRTKDRWGMAMTPDVIAGMATQDAYGWGTGAGCPYGVPGDRLWVRETWHPCDGGPIYAADYDGEKDAAGVQRWFPAIHMRREDSRLDLEVTSLRVERLQDITEANILAEGIDERSTAAIMGLPGEIGCATLPQLWEMAWNAINGKRAPWSSNPWVWVLTFKRVRP